mmetsp:Transcript_61073/g.176971  ORF Transcript_61073/g.176971 Transcript_61073/m.176971 type:complete len:918 (-) Transcript_61073:42-2795(-)
MPCCGGEPHAGQESEHIAQVLDAGEAVDAVTVADTAWEDDAKFASEQLLMIKARTMFNLVEELDEGKKKLLFLTNSQASLIAHSPDNVQKMFDALEVGKPSLVIDLLCSAGFEASVRMQPLNAARGRLDGFFGCVPDRAPFVDADEARQAQCAIDHFMTDVLVPLASQTNAIVLCDAIVGNCVLSDSFLRAAAVADSSWSGRRPFTILTSTADIDELYKGDARQDLGDEHKHWHDVRNASRNWRLRHLKLQEMYLTQEEQECAERDRWRGFDLNPEATCIILTDNISEKRKKLQMDYSAYEALHSAMLQQLRSHLPTIAFRTGAMRKPRTVAETLVETLSVALTRAQVGVPLVFLDVRKRSDEAAMEEALRAEARMRLRDGDEQHMEKEAKEGRVRLIDDAKQQLEAAFAKLQAVGLAESMDSCSLAFLHRAALGTAKAGSKQPQTEALPLHYAIQRARDGLDSITVAGDIPPASKEQVSDITSWLADAAFRSAWEVLEDGAPEKTGDSTYQEVWKEYIHTQATLSRALLLSPNFYSANLHDVDASSFLVKRLVRLDRLPSSNPLEGMLLLQDAWREFDISMLSADRYKLVCKGLFLLQLALGWLVVAVESVAVLFLTSEDNCGSHADTRTFVEESEAIIFAVAVTASAVVAFDSMLTPKARWRQLRSCSGSLESIIWMYRTRAGVFSTDAVGGRDARPETVLCACLKSWRKSLMAGASLMSTYIQREHPPSTFRHFQDKGPVPLPEGSDDHHSPVNPDQYIKLRVHPQIAFYSRRIPVYTRRCTFLKAMVLLLGAAASILAHYGMLPVVVMVTAFSTALTSWAEFEDYNRKVERYSSAVLDLKNLLSWWKALDDVRRAGKESIDCLVRNSEEIISRERTSWMSLAGEKQAEEESNDELGKRLEAATTSNKEQASPS